MDFFSGFIAIIGRPNVGKSTLLNSILEKKLSIISHIPNTTRDKIQGILTLPNHQLIFIDTPGIAQNKALLHQGMIKKAWTSLIDVDLVLFLIDSSRELQKEDDLIIDSLKNLNKKIILVLTKIDLIPKEKLIKRLEFMNTKIACLAMIPISSLKRDNLDHLLDEIKKLMPIGPKYYNENDITNVSSAFIIKDFIREAAIYNVHDELPHSIAIEINKLKNQETKIVIKATLILSKSSHKPIIIGKNAEKINRIKLIAITNIKNYFNKKIFLELHVKVVENWNNSPSFLKSQNYIS